MIKEINGIQHWLWSEGIPTDGLEIRLIFPKMREALAAERCLRGEVGKLSTVPMKTSAAVITISGAKVTFAARTI